MGLFDNEREANRSSCVAMIERVLSELGHQPDAIRSGTELCWNFFHGSASVRVSLVDRDDFLHMRVVAPVMRTDDEVDLLKLYRRLLGLHAEDVCGASFATCDNEIQLVSERSTIDLDLSEVYDIIKRVRDYADHYDNLLVDEFGGQLASSPGPTDQAGAQKPASSPPE
jgi:hypothetical protein